MKESKYDELKNKLEKSQKEIDNAEKFVEKRIDTALSMIRYAEGNDDCDSLSDDSGDGDRKFTQKSKNFYKDISDEVPSSYKKIKDYYLDRQIQDLVDASVKASEKIIYKEARKKLEKKSKEKELLEEKISELESKVGILEKENFELKNSTQNEIKKLESANNILKEDLCNSRKENDVLVKENNMLIEDNKFLYSKALLSQKLYDMEKTVKSLSVKSNNKDPEVTKSTIEILNEVLNQNEGFFHIDDNTQDIEHKKLDIMGNELQNDDGDLGSV